MNREEFERIATATLEGGASTGERRALEAHLASDPAAREAWDDLMIAHAGLAGARLDEPPAGLAPALMAAIEAEARQRAGRKSWLAGLAAALRMRPAFAMASTLAIGIALGVLGLGALTGGFRGGRTLAPSTVASLPANPDSGPPVAIEAGGASIQASAARGGHGVDVRLEARGAAAEVALEWDAAAFELVGVRASPGVGHLAATPGRVAGPMGDGTEWTFTLAPRGAGEGTARVTVRAAGDERQQRLRIPG